MTKRKLSIIIVNYKVKDLLLACIATIYQSSFKNFEIIIVDNDESKKIKQEIEKKFPKVRYIASPRNIGFGRGNNLGAIKANGEYLMFLNPDTEVDKNTFKNLLGFFKKTKKVGIAAPLLLDKNNNPYALQGSDHFTIFNLVFMHSFIRKLNKQKVFNKFWHQDWDKKTAEEVDVVPGTAFMIKNSLFKKLGGFDEDFFLYFEENQICQKVQDAGFKNFMVPTAKVKHLWGESTKQNPDSNKIYKQSRFLFFRKNFGFLNALWLNLFLSIGKYQMILILILLISLFLNLYEINNRIRFIGDQAWFYISARDMLLGKGIPLVGITSSHTWLHQGALWTYILALLLKLSNFNPLTGFYFIGILGTITVLLVYKLGRALFNVNVGLIAAYFYAISPLIVVHTRMSYHTSPIPIITILFLFSIYKWVTGNRWYFPVILFLIGILYNLELATFGMIATFILIVGIGLISKQKFVKNIWNKWILIVSALALIITMLPMLIYDLSHGFPQTLKFGVWIVYRLAIILGYPPISPKVGGETWQTFYNYNSILASDFIFPYSVGISFAVLILAFVGFTVLMLKNIKRKKIRVSYLLMFLFFTIPFIGFLSQKTNSEAYLLIFFPTAAVMIAVFINSLLINKLLNILMLCLFAGLGIYNVNYLLKTNFITDISYNDRLFAAKYIISEAKGRPYNIKGIGPGSEHRSFTMNHEYLTWYLGHPPSESPEKLRFVIYEEPYKIDIKKEEL